EGPVASLAYDEDGNRLLVGLTSSGAVSSYDLTAFLGQQGERGPPPGIGQMDTGLSAVSQIVVPNSGTVILFGGPNGIVEVERETGVELASTELVASGIGYVPAGTGDVSEPRVVAVDRAGSGLFVLDGATLQPVTGVSGTEG